MGAVNNLWFTTSQNVSCVYSVNGAMMFHSIRPLQLVIKILVLCNSVRCGWSKTSNKAMMK